MIENGGRKEPIIPSPRQLFAANKGRKARVVIQMFCSREICKLQRWKKSQNKGALDMSIYNKSEQDRENKQWWVSTKAPFLLCTLRGIHSMGQSI